MTAEGVDAYKEAGVDVDAGNRAVESILTSMRSTHHFATGVFAGPGGYASCQRLSDTLITGYSTDGVGTKLLIAIKMGVLNTVGYDLLGMCVNDVAVTGLKPQSFLDYIAMGKQKPERTKEIVEGIVSACREAEVALLGGEMAEMPDMYREDDFDLAGFAVGFCTGLPFEGSGLMWPSAVEEGSSIWGYPSNGLHSNGFSLVRKAFGLIDDYSTSLLEKHIDDFGMTLGEELLRPTALYPKLIRETRQAHKLVACAHITGGGITENLPRMLPEQCSAHVEVTTWEWPPIFKRVQSIVGNSDDNMLRTFNCGIGLTAVSKDDLSSMGWIQIGTVVPREEKQVLYV